MLSHQSRALDRTITLADLGTLTEAELREVQSELTMAVGVMDERMSSSSRDALRSGIPQDQDWLNRVRKKRRICMAFAAQIADVLDRRTTVDALYLTQLERLVAAEVGATVWAEIKAEARRAAEAP